jgi:hypothetical protein
LSYGTAFIALRLENEFNAIDSRGHKREVNMGKKREKDK